MNESAPVGNRWSRKRFVLIGLMALLLVLALSLRWVSQPSQVAGLILDQVGDALGLEITAGGASEYRLRGTPMIVLRDVIARQPGANTPLLKAERIYLILPWSTLRARGAVLAATRIELDAPQLDLAALQAWQATRPPADTRIPTLSEGLKIIRGRIIGEGWSIDALNLQLPSLHPHQPLRARLDGHYRSRSLRVPFDLVAALTRPAAQAVLGVNGDITVESADWRLPMQAGFSGRLHAGDDGIGLDAFKYGAGARHVTDQRELPFVFGLAGPLRYRSGRFTIAPLGTAIRGEGSVPTIDAHGRLALTDRLRLQLDGELIAWPDTWPTLPPPIGQSTSPLPFALMYEGDRNLSDVTALQLQRDATRFDGRFRLPEILEWMEVMAADTPLPPLDGTLITPRMHISGAVLEGVEIEFDDGASEPEGAKP
ncbi:MAG: hypothetical protein M3374_01610 [Pseudomonadota bacterium]|nr:hypothetical protein [Pseudomonadota bacterium]